MSRIDRIKRQFYIRKALGKTTGAVEGTRRDWEDRYEKGRVYRTETTRGGEWFDEYDVTEEYEY